MSTFGEWSSKAFTPGMIRSRFVGQGLLVESEVKQLSRNNFRLLSLLVVNGVGQGFVIIQDGNLLLGLHTNGDECIAQGIRGTLVLDLVDGLVELESEV